MQGREGRTRTRSIGVVAAVIAWAVVGAPPASAQQARPASIAGVVLDPLNARVPGAAVELLREGQAAGETSSDGQGRFSFSGVEPGRYRVEVRASGFEPQSAPSVYVGSGAQVVVDVVLQIGLRQEVVVTASATEQPASQVAEPVTVIDRQTLDNLEKPSVSEALRLVPGSHVAQAGGRGGITSLFIRGGASNHNKVLVDGIPINDIGGGFDYSNFAVTGVERVEALRDANSVLYGSDAMAGVISITTRRGQTRRPELTASFDGGNLGTHREGASLGGTVQRFDYFGEYSHFSTDNSVDNNAYRNDTFAGRAGLTLGSASAVSGTLRHTSSRYGTPNAVDLFGLADDSQQTGSSTYVGVIAQSQVTPAWHGVVRLASFDDDSDYRNPTPTGEAFDPFGFGANYLGRSTTITGANGFSATGPAILDFGGAYPVSFIRETRRRLAGAQVTWQAHDIVAVSAGGRFEREQGFTDSGSRSSTDRDNYGSFVELRAKRRRLFANAGLGYDHNAIYGTAWTPRVSAAVYLREPSVQGPLGDTKLVFNLGRGIKGPTIAQETSSLFELIAAAPNPTASVSPIGPERNRSLDVGLEQAFAQGRLRVRASYFDNRYQDLVEFLSQSALVRLGIPRDVASATAFGAYVNSSSYSARGLEASVEGIAGRRFRLKASYTYLDAEVSESFSSSALAPVENPAFPGIAIGAYGPLVGARPFRRPPHSGNLLATYAEGPVQLSLAAYVAGKSDDSTFLSDAFFGNSLLLPNRDLNGGYQKIDLSGSYRLVRSRVKLYVSAENVLDEHYTPAFGFPALPRTIRVGVAGTLGGDGRPRP